MKKPAATEIGNDGPAHPDRITPPDPRTITRQRMVARCERQLEHALAAGDPEAASVFEAILESVRR